MFGELSIVPSSDLGEIGQQQGQATTIDWKWYYSAAGSLIWLALIVAVLVPRANHHVHIAWILVPLVVVNLAWLAFKKLLGMPSSVASQSDAVFQSMVVGTAALWLMVDYLRKVGGFVRFLVCLGVFVAAACLSIVSYYVKFSRETPLFFTLFLLLALAILGAISLSRRLCGGRYRPIRFMLWLALWIVLGSWVALGGSVLIASIVLPGGPRLLEVILVAVVGGSALGLCLYVLNLPFMILGFVHPFFRERLCACLGLQPVANAPASQTETSQNTCVASVPAQNQGEG